ncbi:LuxR C-terminal-related transcriptional regulator [Methylobacterium sp. J-088]|uniref:LuxR C-terminal-related transcriptional regulator n=1 Tax=Methylobacterium sp. J-088 TaxID=2836664 RepID=UPI001FB94E77|nr:LuxR C-terminal-related transcriptional regulator [Methylobacterium sp. J-088]MCJ2065966.1 LuxR C-terminal-related transcriptional regulator [Methylobacterium sp. J-088]
MSASARDILSLIQQIGGPELARRVRQACTGKRVSLSVVALLSDAHPFRQILDASAMAQLVEVLRNDLRRGDHVRFPVAAESAYLRDREARAQHLRRLITAGLSTGDIACAVRVSSRTVENHRARMRREVLSLKETQA